MQWTDLMIGGVGRDAEFTAKHIAAREWGERTTRNVDLVESLSN
jgi:hypothetical protein